MKKELKMQTTQRTRIELDGNEIRDFFSLKFHGDDVVMGNPSLIPPILEEEAEIIQANMKNGKACGPDGVPNEFLKKISPSSLAQCLDSILRTGAFLEEQKDSVTTLIPKKSRVKAPKDLRPIGLLNHGKKALANVFNIRHDLNQYIDPCQAAYRPGRSTVELIASIRISRDIARVGEKKLYGAMMDMSGAFDNVNKNKLFDELKRVDEGAAEMFAVLYSGCQTTLKVDGQAQAGSIPLGRGVQQGDAAAPVLYTFYYDRVLKRAQTQSSHITNVVENLIYADDHSIFCESEEDLEEYARVLEEVGREDGLVFNVEKTQKFEIGDSRGVKYLGCLINEDEELKVRKAMALEATRKVRMKVKKASAAVKRKCLEVYVKSVLFYGVEAIAMNKKRMDKLEAAWRSCVRVMFGVRWQDKVRNEDLYVRTGTRRIEEEVNARQKSFYEHLQRHQDLPIWRKMMEFRDLWKEKKKRGRPPTMLCLKHLRL